MRFISVLFFCFFVNFISAQNPLTKIKGIITDGDAATKDPLSFATVLFQGTNITTYSDLDGSYSIEIQTNKDTLIFSMMGYITQKIKVQLYKTQEVNITLLPNDNATTTTKEVVIRPTDEENPCNKILRKVIAAKDKNNAQNVSAYEYNTYNKIQFDINNFDKKFKESRIFKKAEFIFDNADSTDDGRAFLPIFISESMSTIYYNEDPRNKKEIVIANKTSGIKSDGIAQFSGDMYQKVNVYDNYLEVFGKSFISPITDNFLRFYRYYIMDTVVIEGRVCFQILFNPKHKQDLTFTGDIFVDTLTMGIKRTTVKFNEEANVNFVKSFSVRQNYELIDGKTWFLQKEEALGDFRPLEMGKGTGFFGRKTTVYSKFLLNKPKEIMFFEGENIIIQENATTQSDTYWQEARPEKLSKTENNVYKMIDTLATIPRIRNMALTFTLLTTGFWISKKVSIGEYYTFASFNPIEKYRFKFGGKTSNDFSKRVLLEGYVAYGIGDKRFKYSAGAQFFLSPKKENWARIGINYKHDLEQIGLTNNAIRFDNILNIISTNLAGRKFLLADEYSAYFSRDFKYGFQARMTVLHKRFDDEQGIYFGVYDPANLVVFENTIYITEATLSLRYAKGEKFISGQFKRASTGTTAPIFSLDIGLGMKVFRGELNYQRIKMTVEDRIRLPPYGYVKYLITAGKIFGKVPYPLLELHPGNQNITMLFSGFNMMNVLEFASDQYASFTLDHHMEGYFFNKIPYIRKLKWREVIGLKTVTGSLSADNKHLLSPIASIRSLGKPYLEVSAGVENILKFFRVDAFWRLTHLQNPLAPRFSIKIGASVGF